MSNYSRERVRTMRTERKRKKPTKAGLSTNEYQTYLGELVGAGHLQINDFQ